MSNDPRTRPVPGQSKEHGDWMDRRAEEQRARRLRPNPDDSPGAELYRRLAEETRQREQKRLGVRILDDEAAGYVAGIRARNAERKALEALQRLEESAPSAVEAALNLDVREARGLLLREAAKIGMVIEGGAVRNMPAAIHQSTLQTKTAKRDQVGAVVSALAKQRAPVDISAIEQAIWMLLEAIGEDPTRPGLQDTPARVARFWREFIDYDPGRTDTTFAEEKVTSQMVTVSGVRVWSMCEHHLLPFFTDISMGYIANGQVLGLSKFARIAQAVAHGLQTQENIAEQIAEEIAGVTGSRDVAVLCENGMHTCMVARGIRADGSMNNAVMRGVFFSDASARAEFYNLIQRSRK